MKIKSILAVMLLLTVMLLTPLGVFAEPSDVDFTLKVDTDTSYIPGDEVSVPIVVKTQTDNGYVFLELLLKYDSDIFTCTTTLNNDKGFTTELVEEGLKISYEDPSGAGKVSEIGEVEIPLKFAVLTGAAGGETTFSLTVNIAQGLDSNGNRENNMKVSNANDKTVEIVAIEDGGGAATTTAPTIYSVTTTTHAVDSNDGVSIGTVIVFVIGAIVLFFAGMVVGYLMCSKKNSSFDDYSDSSEDDGEYYRRSSRRATMLDDDFGNDRQDEYGYHVSPRRPSVGFNQDDEDEVPISSSYFGDSGSDSDDDDEEGFPDEFKPRRRTPSLETDDVDDEIYGSYSNLGSRRRTRSDDGFGSYSGDDDEFRFDRRKYR